MSDFLLTAAGLLVAVLVAAWPWTLPTVRYLLSLVRINFARSNLLVWAEPKAGAPGMYLTFTGAEIGHRFFGSVTSQEAAMVKPEPIRKIIVENV